MMDEWVSALEREWDAETGFIGMLRFGTYQPDAFERMMVVLQSIDVADREYIPRDLIRLLWMIPMVMEGQQPHFARQPERKNLEPSVAAVQNELQRILGVP
jgi:hypothetical protein